MSPALQHITLQAFKNLPKTTCRASFEKQPIDKDYLIFSDSAVKERTIPVCNNLFTVNSNLQVRRAFPQPLSFFSMEKRMLLKYVMRHSWVCWERYWDLKTCQREEEPVTSITGQPLCPRARSLLNSNYCLYYFHWCKSNCGLNFVPSKSTNRSTCV